MAGFTSWQNDGVPNWYPSCDRECSALKLDFGTAGLDLELHLWRVSNVLPESTWVSSGFCGFPLISPKHDMVNWVLSCLLVCERMLPDDGPTIHPRQGIFLPHAWCFWNKYCPMMHWHSIHLIQGVFLPSWRSFSSRCWFGLGSSLAANSGTSRRVGERTFRPNILNRLLQWPFASLIRNGMLGEKLARCLMAFVWSLIPPVLSLSYTPHWLWCGGGVRFIRLDVQE